MVILRSIKLSTAVAAFALFFLPWVEIRCSPKSMETRTLATQTGIQTITGQATPSEKGDSRRGEGRQEPLGSAGLVAAALLATGLAIACLLVALLNNQLKLDVAGSVLSGLALLCLLAQLMQGFPAKDEIVSQISTDQATNQLDAGSFLALQMQENIQLQILPAFTVTCVLLGIPVLLILGQLLVKFRASKTGAASLLLVFCLVGCDSQNSTPPEAKSESVPEEPVLNGGDYVLRKLDAIVIPVADFEDTTLADAVEFVRHRAAELDPDPDDSKKGMNFVIRGAVRQGPAPEAGLEAALNGEDLLQAEGRKLITLKENNIKVMDLLIMCAEQAGMNFYLTSRGFVMIPETGKLNEKIEREQGVEIWKVFREVDPRSAQREAVIDYFNRVRIPSVNFEDTTLEDAVEFLRQRSLEVEEPPGYQSPKGVSMVVRQSQAKSTYPDADILHAADDEGTKDDGHEATPEAALNHPEPPRIPRYQAKDALLKDILADLCEILSFDAYVTSGGPCILPEGEKPKEGLEVWMVIRKAGE